uniref:Core-binding (CB) domain-containing protein n=1 Tax=Varanus komodoensis TaxID=61221 RepID=A0A8D2IP31_VARKO
MEIQGRYLEAGITQQCDTGKIYSCKELNELHKTELPLLPLSRQLMNPVEWLKIPPGYIESEIRQKSRIAEVNSLADPMRLGTDSILTATNLSTDRPLKPNTRIAASNPLASSASLDSMGFPLGSTVFYPEIQSILDSALRPSTQRSYAAKWQRFSTFAESRSFPSHSASIQNILQFLLELRHLGLKPSSIKVYTAAISYYRGTIQGSSIFSQLLIKRFLKGL